MTDVAQAKEMRVYTKAQEIFLRQLGGDHVGFAERSSVRITKATQRSLQSRGLVEYGRLNGSATLGWHLTTDGEPEAKRLIKEVAERREADVPVRQVDAARPPARRAAVRRGMRGGS